MAVYSVYYRPPGHAAGADMALVKDGFCWPAFLLTVLWALWSRLWLVAVGLVATNVLLAAALALAGLDPVGRTVASLGFMALVGYGAAGLRGWTLERRGYAFTDLVSGDGQEEAERKFLTDRPDVTRALLNGEKRDDLVPASALGVEAAS